MDKNPCEAYIICNTNCNNCSPANAIIGKILYNEPITDPIVQSL